MDDASLPGPEPPFLCDAMLARLGRWLRAAGYDTLIAHGGTDDRDIITRAISDRRIILTRDRKLREIRGAMEHAAVLHGERLADLVAEITGRFAVDWTARPFSRCLVCNLPLSPAPPVALNRLPPDVPTTAASINYCRQCDRLYWPGGHVRRMLRRLERWNAGEFM